jgi:hypothetical protein
MVRTAHPTLALTCSSTPTRKRASQPGVRQSTECHRKPLSELSSQALLSCPWLASSCPSANPRRRISSAPAAALCRGIPNAPSRHGATTKPSSSASPAMPSGFSPGRRKSLSVFPLQAILGPDALVLLCFLLWCRLLATCWCRHMRRFNEANSAVHKVGASETAIILKHCLTLRSNGSCAIRPRSGPELGCWASQIPPSPPSTLQDSLYGSTP